MKTIAAISTGVFALILSCVGAMAQTYCSPLTYHNVLTTGQWQQCFQQKQDLLGYTAVNKAGDAMSGRLTTTASTINQSGFSIFPGVSPISPADGDIWTTSAGLYVRINGTTIGPLASSVSFSLIVGTTPIGSGTTKGLIYNNAGFLGNLATANSGVLVTDSSGNPSISSALPSALTVPSATLSGTPKMTGLATGSCSNGTGIDASNNVIKTPCAGVAQVGSTTVASGTSGAFLYNNAGTLANASPATKTDQQTGTSSTNVVTPSQQQSHDSAAKAWAMVTQSAGTYTVQSSYNVTSVSKTSTGRITVNMTTAFASSNYACVASPDGTRYIITTPVSASALAVSINDNALAPSDAGFSVACYGRQ